MKLFICLLVLSFSGFTQDQLTKESLSLFHLNKENKEISGVSYPRTDVMYYRGLRGGFDLKSAIDSFYGNSFASLESKSLTNSRHILAGTESPIKKAKYYAGLDSAIEADLGKIKTKKKFKTVEKSKDRALEYLDNHITKLSDKDLSEKYLNYNSSKYEDWSGDLVFGTVYYGGAKQYGDMVVAYKDFNKRGVDLNYYNNTAHYMADYGEYILPLHIRADEVVGFQKKSIGESFYKVTYEGRVYTLVFGPEVTCVDRDEATQEIFNCSDDSPYSWDAPLPKRLDKPVPKAILGACPKKHKRKCGLPEGLVKKYGLKKEPGELSEEAKKVISEFSYGDNDLLVHHSKNLGKKKDEIILSPLTVPVDHICDKGVKFETIKLSKELEALSKYTDLDVKARENFYYYFAKPYSKYLERYLRYLKKNIGKKIHKRKMIIDGNRYTIFLEDTLENRKLSDEELKSKIGDINLEHFWTKKSNNRVLLEFGYSQVGEMEDKKVFHFAGEFKEKAFFTNSSRK